MNKIWKIGLLLWMETVIYAAFTFLPPVEGFRVPAEAKIMIFHVPNTIAAPIFSILSAYFAIRFLMTKDLRDDAKSRVGAGLAMLFWLLTTVTGMLFAQIQWGLAWNWDPKQAGIFVLLLVYLSYFALRSAFPEGSKQATVASVWTVFASLTAPFLTYVLPNSKGVQSLHPQGVIWKMGGMGLNYAMIFWCAAIGLTAVGVWIYRVNTRFDLLRLSVNARTFSGEGS